MATHMYSTFFRKMKLKVSFIYARAERLPRGKIIEAITIMNLQCESKKSPLRGPDISHFSHKRLRIFNRFLHTYYTFLSTLDYKFLFKYLQL